MRIIFAGTMGLSGLGGQAWACLQYLLGLRALGHEVFYLEDCGESSWAYDWGRGEWTAELDYPANYVRACLEPFGFQNRWIYRTSEGSLGMPLADFREACSGADLLILRAVPLWVWRKEYDLPRRRAFIDVDPGFTQVNLANGDQGLALGIGHCERRFTIGARIGKPECLISNAGGPWLTTRSPVVLDQWPFASGEATHFTSVIRWQGISVFGENTQVSPAFGQRDREFARFLDVPRLTPQKFRLAMLGTDAENLTQHGWEVEPGEIISETPSSYRAFIQGSRGEFAVPKHGYVATRGGWFSDRSVCYLASGRPVLIGETGLSEWIPTGNGLITYRDVPEALAGIERINGEYERHRRAARQLAEDYFDAQKVLPPLLEAAMN